MKRGQVGAPIAVQGKSLTNASGCAFHLLRVLGQGIVSERFG